MTVFLVSKSDNNSKIENLLIQCLEKAGFEVVKSENSTFIVDLTQNQLSTPEEKNKSNTQITIFPSTSKLSEVFDFIELNYHQSIRLKEVAEAVGYSSAYLTDLVRRMTGKTVNNWIIERRIAEAKRLLSETEDSIEQIAFTVGYQNINHFYYQFRNYCRDTPRSWRRKQLSQQD